MFFKVHRVRRLVYRRQYLDNLSGCPFRTSRFFRLRHKWDNHQCRHYSQISSKELRLGNQIRPKSFAVCISSLPLHNWTQDKSPDNLRYNSGILKKNKLFVNTYLQECYGKPSCEGIPRRSTNHLLGKGIFHHRKGVLDNESLDKSPVLQSTCWGMGR